MLSYSIKMLLPPPQKNVHVPTKHNCIPAKRSRIHKNTLAFATKQKKSSQKPLHSHKKQPHSKKIPTFIQNESHSKRTRIYTKRSDSHKNCLRSHSKHLHSYEALSHSHRMNLYNYKILTFTESTLTFTQNAPIPTKTHSHSHKTYLQSYETNTLAFTQCTCSYKPSIPLKHTKHSHISTERTRIHFYTVHSFTSRTENSTK